MDQSNAINAAETRSGTPYERAQYVGEDDREGWEDVERAIAADEQRIAIELVGTVIRDLFGVGLTLSSVIPHVARPGEQALNTAIDDIDRIIRSIRDVVFALETRTPPRTTSGSASRADISAEATLADVG